MHQLETLLESTVDKSFDKFEIYTLRNILTIPDDLAPWMRLAHYEVRQLFSELCDSRRCTAMLLMLSTGHPAAALIHRPNSRIDPPTPTQSPRNPQTESCAPIFTLAQRSPHYSTQIFALSGLSPRCLFTCVPYIPYEPGSSVSQPLIFALI